MSNDEAFTEEQLSKLNVEQATALLQREIARVASTLLPRVMSMVGRLVPASEVKAASDPSVTMLLAACALAKVHGASEEGWYTLCEAVWDGVSCEVMPMTKGGNS